MSEFILNKSVTVKDGEIEEVTDAPVMSFKKLHGQGNIYKLTDANAESINIEMDNGKLQVDKFIRSIRSNFGPGKYKVGAISHIPLAEELKGFGYLRVEYNTSLNVTENQHHWDLVDNTSPTIFFPEGPAVVDLESWYSFVEKSKEDAPDSVSDEFVEFCRKFVDETPKTLEETFNNTSFEKIVNEMDKISVVQHRKYDQVDT
jgi:hypothetical protein